GWNGSGRRWRAFTRRQCAASGFPQPAVYRAVRYSRHRVHSRPAMELLTDRTTIIALAIAGGCLATAGSLLRSRSRNTARLAHLMVWVGYLVSLASMSLFVAAGFLSNRRHLPADSRRFPCPPP